MWGQTIFPGSQPFNSHMYICCIYLFCFVPSFLHRASKEKFNPFSPKGRAFVTMSNSRNIRISDGCIYIRKGLGIHLVTYMNCDTVPFLLSVQYKGGLSETEFTVTLFSNVSMVFLPFSFSNFMHFFLYKERNCPFSLGNIEKLPVSGMS